MLIIESIKKNTDNVVVVFSKEKKSLDGNGKREAGSGRLCRPADSTEPQTEARQG